jgi:hypothetical protein
MSRTLKPLKGVAVSIRCAEPKPNTERDRNVDHYLYGLPQVKHDNIRRIGGRFELFDRCRKLRRYAVEMPYDSRHALGQDIRVERCHLTKSPKDIRMRGANDVLGIEPEDGRLVAKVLERIVDVLVQSNPLTSDPVTQQAPGACQIRHIDVVGLERVGECRSKRQLVKPVGGKISEVPIGSPVGVSACTRTVHGEQPQPGDRARGSRKAV